MLSPVVFQIVTGLCGIAIGYMIHFVFSRSFWERNATRKEIITSGGRYYKVVDVNNPDSANLLREVADTDLPKIHEHRYCFVHQGSLSKYSMDNCEMCKTEKELEEARTHIAQQQEILDDLASGGFVRSVLVPAELKDKIFALNKDKASEEFVRRIKANTLEEFANDYGCVTSRYAMQEANRIRNEKK